MRLSPGVRLGAYDIVAQLGAGGMGEVYRAEDTRLRRHVAIKVLPDEFAHDAERSARFQLEAQVLASLSHPNIATLYGLEESDGQRFITMELVEGQTLTHRLLKGPLPADEVLEVCRQIAEGLEAAHEKGVIHRDLKPANVMITPNDKVKILDFGLARVFHDQPSEADQTDSPTITGAMTRAGTVLGTAAYMSPEQAKGEAVDKRADIWAFGCVLYELLTGRQAFGRKTHVESLAAIVTAEPDWTALPATTPPHLRRLIEHCLCKDQARRLRDIADARLDLEDSTVPQAPVAGPFPTKPRRPVGWVAASVVLLLALAAVSILHWRERPLERRAAKLALLPPEGAVFGPIEISPDGRFLAFVATDARGETRLWVRPLDSLNARPLSGTTGAQLPFWSPDSRYIGFFADGALKKIDASGGPAQTLCRAPFRSAGAAWNREGVIIFANYPGGPLRSVSTSGGESKPLTELDQTRRETSHRWPQFLPDGRRFIYFARATQRENSGTYLGSLNSKNKILLLRSDTAAQHAGSHLLFLREQTLMAQSFDIAKGVMSGDAFPIAEPVGLDGAGLRGLFSASENGVLVYPTIASVTNSLLWFDRAGKQLGAVGPLGAYFSLSLSPDDKRLAANRRDPQTETNDIWLFELSRGIASRFTFDPSNDAIPVWSPDGARIAFFSDRNGPRDLYVKAASGAGQEELLCRSGNTKLPSNWSPDGRFLLYFEDDPKTRSDLWALPLEGERKPIPVLRTEFNEYAGRLSPDGRWMAYASDASGREEVYVQPFVLDSSGAGGKWLISTDGGREPRWRRDGKEIFYLAADHQLMVVEVKITGATFEAATPRPLFRTRVAGLGSPYDVTADGQRFIIVSAAEEVVSAPATVVLNWQAGLNR